MATRYSLTIYKPVSDILRGFVTIEAESADQAEAIARDMLGEDKIALEFWQCADNPEPIQIETEEAKEEG